MPGIALSVGLNSVDLLGKSTSTPGEVVYDNLLGINPEALDWGSNNTANQFTGDTEFVGIPMGPVGLSFTLSADSTLTQIIIQGYLASDTVGSTTVMLVADDGSGGAGPGYPEHTGTITEADFAVVDPIVLATFNDTSLAFGETLVLTFPLSQELTAGHWWLVLESSDVSNFSWYYNVQNIVTGSTGTSGQFGFDQTYGRFVFTDGCYEANIQIAP